MLEKYARRRRAWRSRRQQGANGVNRISILRLLVGPPPGDSGEAHRDPRAVAAGALDALEVQLEDQLRFDGANRPELLQRVSPDEGVHLPDLLIGQAGIRLGEG